MCHETLYMQQWQIFIQMVWKWDSPGIKKPKEKGTFDFAGPNWVMFLDEYDKLMGFQNFLLLSTVLSILQVENSRSKCG